MSEEITKEMREFAETFFNPTQRGKITAMADDIDKAYRDAFTVGHVMGAKSAYEVKASIAIQDASDEVLTASGAARLPMDADGEPWHVGDMVAAVHRDGKSMFPFGEVVNMVLGRYGVWTLKVMDAGEFNPRELHHYRPTIADRIRECAQDLARGRCERPDPKLGDDVATTVSARLAAIAGEIEAREDAEEAEHEMELDHV